MKGLYIKTYGCQMNVYDSVLMENIIKPLGFNVVGDVEKADLVILNTCHIRKKAAEKLYSELGKIRSSRENKETTIVVAGCVAQAEGEEVFRRAPFVDIVVGPQSIATLPELIAKASRSKGHAINTDFPEVAKFDKLPDEYYGNSQGSSAFLSIQEGCDKFCTFCVVPYTRGAEYSRPVSKIFREALKLVANGAKEINLLGQNVNAYHGECAGEVWDLGKLISHIAKIEKLERIRYTTSHPRDMHESLYLAHAEEPKLMPFVHLPVQSGSNKILRAMNRKHTAEEYLEIIDKLRKLKPEIEFSSDFIVGFPGETEKDFEETMELVEKVKYAQAYSFKYSPRPGTPGAERKDQVPEEVKTERLLRLQKLISAQQLEFNQSVVGKTIPVLFSDKKGKRRNQIIGKSPCMQSVCIGDPKGKYRDKIINVKILEARQNSLLGCTAALLHSYLR
ncbi:MAG: tRNA (N6-isopentenyl adenosine(37)-C2)-methylthiotransferase MiaB [Wolbachia sp.]